MSAEVYVLPLWTKNPPGKVVSTIARDRNGLSPFLLGPCPLYWKFISKNMENGWQYSKVYKQYMRNGDPTNEYFRWAERGWNKVKADRYPMGKGAIPECSYWDGEHLGYIGARKAIYGPLYVKAVRKTEAWRKLKQDYKKESVITLLDYDAYDHRKLGMSLTDVLKEPKRKMGHAFVLAMLLTEDPALEKFRM